MNEPVAGTVTIALNDYEALKVRADDVSAAHNAEWWQEKLNEQNEVLIAKNRELMQQNEKFAKQAANNQIAADKWNSLQRRIQHTGLEIEVAKIADNFCFAEEAFRHASK